MVGRSYKAGEDWIGFTPHSIPDITYANYGFAKPRSKCLIKMEKLSHLLQPTMTKKSRVLCQAVRNESSNLFEACPMRAFLARKGPVWTRPNYPIYIYEDDFNQPLTITKALGTTTANLCNE